MWDALLRGLAMPVFFGTIVSHKGKGDFEVDEDEAVKIIALAYYHRDVQEFPNVWDPVRVLHGDVDRDIERFVDIIRLAVFNINGDKGNLLCPTYFSFCQQCTRVGATMEHWQGAFAQTMPEVRCKGRG